MVFDTSLVQIECHHFFDVGWEEVAKYSLTGDLCVIMEKRPYKTHYLTGFMQNSKFVACNPFKLRSPHFPRWGLFMEKRPHKTN